MPESPDTQGHIEMRSLSNGLQRLADATERNTEATHELRVTLAENVGELRQVTAVLDLRVKTLEINSEGRERRRWDILKGAVLAFIAGAFGWLANQMPSLFHAIPAPPHKP